MPRLRLTAGARRITTGAELRTDKPYLCGEPPWNAS
jgi:hypothetical protein